LDHADDCADARGKRVSELGAKRIGGRSKLIPGSIGAEGLEIGALPWDSCFCCDQARNGSQKDWRSELAHERPEVVDLELAIERRRIGGRSMDSYSSMVAQILLATEGLEVGAW